MGKRAASTRPSETPEKHTDLAIREKPASPHKRRASSASQPGKTDSAMDKTAKSSLENKERAYVAASRRMDRSLEDRIKSAHQASEVHFQRTGKRFRITRENVEKGLWYDEIDDLPRHRLAEHTMDYQTRTRYQEVDDQFSQVFGNMMPRFPSSYSVHFMQYQQYAPPPAMPTMPVQQQLSGYQLPQPPVSYTTEDALAFDRMQYPYGANGPPAPNPQSSRRSISPASSASAASREPATSVSPVSNGTSSNPTSPESEVDSSAAEIMASASRHNSFDNFTTSNSPMLAQAFSFTNFTTSAPSNTILADAIDPELHSPPTACFADLGFEDIAAAYPGLGSFDFQPPARMVDKSNQNSPAAAVPEDDWEDLLNPAEFDEVAVAQGAQGWAYSG